MHGTVNRGEEKKKLKIPFAIDPLEAFILKSFSLSQRGMDFFFFFFHESNRWNSCNGFNPREARLGRRTDEISGGKRDRGRQVLMAQQV